MPVPIEYIGGKSAGIVGGTTATVVPLSSGLTGGLDVAATVGDLVIVTISVGTAARAPAIAIATPAGYTPLTAQRTTASTADANVQTCYKFMPDPADTSVTIPASGNAADGLAYAIQVFYGVDPTTPMDVTPTYATGSGVNNRPVPAAITTVTPGATIVVCGGGAAATGTTLYTSADFDAFRSANGADTTDGTVGVGHIAVLDAGTYSFVAFGGGNVNAANSWGCTTLALRPMVGDIFDDATEIGAGSDTTDAVVVPILDMTEGLGGSRLDGYWAGGWTTGALNVLTKFNYAAESIATLAAVLSPGRYGMTSFSSITKGYLCGDNNSANSSNVTLLDFANDTLTNDGFMNYYNTRTAGWSSVEFGYMAGGYSSYYGYTTHIQRRSLTTSTASLLSAVITGARSVPCGVQSSIKGYVAGGYSGTAPVNTVSGMVLATETAFTPAATLTSIRQSPIGLNGLTKGYVQGGWDTFSMLATTDTINHATDAVASAGFTMSTSRNGGGGISSPTKGYAAGGWDGFGASNQIDGITFATDAGINPAAALPYACELPTGVYKNTTFAGAREYSDSTIVIIVLVPVEFGEDRFWDKTTIMTVEGSPTVDRAEYGANPPAIAVSGAYGYSLQWISLVYQRLEPEMTVEMSAAVPAGSPIPLIQLVSYTEIPGSNTQAIAPTLAVEGGLLKFSVYVHTGVLPYPLGNTVTVFGTTPIVAGVIYDFALVYASRTFKVYLNGVLELTVGGLLGDFSTHFATMGASSVANNIRKFRVTFAARYLGDYTPTLYGTGQSGPTADTVDAANIRELASYTAVTDAADGVAAGGDDGAIEAGAAEGIAESLRRMDEDAVGAAAAIDVPTGDRATDTTGALVEPATVGEAVSGASQLEGVIPPEAQGDFLYADVLAILRGDKARDPRSTVPERYTPSTSEFRFPPSSMAVDGTVGDVLNLGDFKAEYMVPHLSNDGYEIELRFAFGREVVYYQDVSGKPQVERVWSIPADFCAELWVLMSPGSTRAGVLDFLNYQIGVFNGAIHLFRGYVMGEYGANSFIKTAAVVSNGVWNHFALSRAGAEITLYFNGDPLIVTDDLLFTTASQNDLRSGWFGMGFIDTNPPVGDWWPSNVEAAYLTGFMDDIRVTAHRRYTGAFTPSAVENPDWLRALDTRDVVVTLAGTGNTDIYAPANATDTAASSAQMPVDCTETGTGDAIGAAASRLYLDQAEALVISASQGANRLSPVFSDEQTFAYAFPDGQIHLFFSVSEVSVAGAVVRIAETIEGSVVEAAAAIERILIAALGPRLSIETLHHVAQQVIDAVAAQGGQGTLEITIDPDDAAGEVVRLSIPDCAVLVKPLS